MKISIHNGNSVKVASDKTGVILDPNEKFQGTADISAVFFSRFTPERISLLRSVLGAMPVHMSKGAAILTRVYEILYGSGPEKTNAVPAAPKKKIKIGDMSVTPHLVDYSAYDALAFTLSFNGRNIFYSSDPRGHRAWRSLYKRITGKPAEPIDCLILNGITVGGKSAALSDEHAVKQSMIKAFGGHKGCIFVNAKYHDIERICSTYKACQISGRTLVIDLAAAFTLSLMRGLSDRVPQPHWPGIRVKFSGEEAAKLQAAGYRELLHFIDKSKIDIFDMRRKRHKLVIMTNDPGVIKPTIKDIEAADALILDHTAIDGSIPKDELKEFIAAVKPGMLVVADQGMLDAVSGMFPDISVKMLRGGEEIALI